MSEDVSRAAAIWDERYQAEHYAYGLEPNAFLVAQSHRLTKGMRALVPGDGEGRNGVWLAAQGLEVDTLDLSGHGVAKAKKLAADRGVRINALQADAVAWEWPKLRYDLIALIFLHLAEAERRAVHAKALGALKPGGLIVLEAFRPEQIERQQAGARGGPRDPELLYPLVDIEEDFAHEETLLLETAEVTMGEGRLHVGDSAVVRALVRKR